MAKTEENTLLAHGSLKKADIKTSDQLIDIENLSPAMLYKEYREMVKREERIALILSQSTELIFALSLDRKVLIANDQALDFFKKQSSSSLLVGQQFLPDSAGETSDLWKGIIDKAQSGIPFEKQIEWVYETQVFHYKLRFQPQKDEKGELKELWFFGRDVTEEKNALEIMYKKEAMLESISNSVQEGIFRSSTEEGIIYVNQAFARMFGYESTEEIMAVEPYELYMNPSRRDDFVQIIQKQDSFFNEEVEFKRKDGSSFWGLISSVSVIDKSGKKFHDGAIRDVTKLKEVERGLKDNYKELQKVNRELDRFVYSTSHDLRAPLVSIAGLINITRIEKSEELRQKYLGLMDTSIQKLDNFIKDIIGYSRNSRLEVKAEKVDIQQLVEVAVDALKPKDDSNVIRISITHSSQGDFFSDNFRLNTIFNNLLSNAFRYYDPSKEDSFIAVEIEQDETRAKICVRDNGIGIEEKYLDKIFQMFYRATQKSQGSGIGLYIVKESIEKLGGHIEVESTVGEGTTFRLEIPQGKPGDD